MPPETKERCSSRLKRGLGVSAIVLTVLLIWSQPFLSAPSVPKTFWGLFDRHDDCVSFRDCELFTVGETTIYLQRRNFLTIEKGRDDQALVFSGKLNLSPPFNPTSLDSKLRGKIEESSSCGAVGETLSNSFKTRSEDKKWLASTVRKGYWTLDLTAEPCLGEASWNLNGWRVFYLAGVSAQPKQGGEASLTSERKPGIIADGVKELCESAHEAGIEELLMSFIGTGAAGVDKVRAADAILSGINQAAFKGKAPRTVIIGLFPGLGHNDAELQAQWNETGEVFRTIVQAPLTDPDLNVWSYLHVRTRAFQVLLILLASVVSALIAATVTLPDVQLRATAVAHKAVFWALVASGLLSLKTFTLGDPRPLSWLTALIIALLAFLAPLWSWHGLDKSPGLSDKSACRYPSPSNSNDRDQGGL